jgi:hypothetical protein
MVTNGVLTEREYDDPARRDGHTWTSWPSAPRLCAISPHANAAVDGGKLADDVDSHGRIPIAASR